MTIGILALLDFFIEKYIKVIFFKTKNLILIKTIKIFLKYKNKQHIQESIAPSCFLA